MTAVHHVTREEMLRDLADPARRDREALRELQARHNEMFAEYCAMNFALGLLTGHFPPFNEHTKKLADELLARRKAEWEQKTHREHHD